ncbi:glutaredoxin domain-containing cysteine-rich protein 2 [Scleropages formosus]|uniref:glutaredoxin domain-containing cysteine-rich protein 2 n=1 Tax=Scleropages formosus TaxID=113540 RepID=UPI0010FAA9C0|nr:glutaredoxin domain-containing cysteine-rich protein 2 [Scleropages formosus]
MEKSQRKPGQRQEGQPRKVRFKIASSYSGRVLKHVYEDGQELESPGEKYPRSFKRGKTPRHLEAEQLRGFQDPTGPAPGPPTGLIAQRINVYRGVTNYRPPTYGELSAADCKPPVLDFGKIIIYTSNLRIIRSPHRRSELMKSSLQRKDSGEDFSLGTDRVEKAPHHALCIHGEDGNLEPKHEEGSSCPQCGGTGCMPCSLCHGSKLSMLANRFNESIRALRCPACYPDGLQRCQSCTEQQVGKR